jgi:manganese/iron transport system permease protein
MEEIQRLLASSIIGATAHDVAVFAALAVVTAVGLGVFRRAVLLLAIDPAMAEAVGLRVTLWNFALAAWLGLVIGLAIHSAGMLFTFGCLVLPALIAKNVCRNMAPLFLVSPVVALLTSVAAFVLANEFDFPPAQMTVALMGLLLALAWSLRPRG